MASSPRRKSKTSKTLIITGVAEIDRALKRLPDAIAKKAIRQGMRPALKPMLAEARMLVGKKSGRLRKAIKIRAMKRKVGRIGIKVSVGANDFTGETFYAGMVEAGHKVVSNLGGKGTGHVAGYAEGKHFMRRAYDKHKTQARDDGRRNILANTMKAISEEAAK